MTRRAARPTSIVTGARGTTKQRSRAGVSDPIRNGSPRSSTRPSRRITRSVAEDIDTCVAHRMKVDGLIAGHRPIVALSAPPAALRIRICDLVTNPVSALVTAPKRC